jgi:hypothetical protein
MSIMVVFYTQFNNPSMTSPLRNEALLLISLIDNSNADPCRDDKSAVRWADRTGKSAQLLGGDAPLTSDVVVHSANPVIHSRVRTARLCSTAARMRRQDRAGGR